MQTKGMRKVSFFLALIIFCTSVWFSFAQTVYAKQPSDILKERLESLLENAPEEIAKEILLSLGIVLIDLDSFWTDSAAIELYKDYLKDAYAQGLIGIVDSGFFVSQSVVEHTKQVFEENATVDVVWMPIVSSDDLPSDWFETLSLYYKVRSYADNRSYSMVRYYSTSSGRAYGFFDISNNYFQCASSANATSIFNGINTWTSSWGNKTTSANFIEHLLLLDSDGLEASLSSESVWNMYTGDKMELTFSNAYNVKPIYPFTVNRSSFPYTNWYDTGFLIRGCNTDAVSFVPVFRDKSAFIKFFTGQGSYYKFESGYQGGDITINPDADYSAITDAIADVMKQSIANGDNMSTMLSRMQAAFSKTLAEISGTLDDIGDNTAETNSWLEKIFGLLETQQKEMQDYFKSAQESLDQIPDQISGAAQDIADAIQDTGQAIVDAISGITAGGGGSPPVIAPGDYPDGNQIDSSSGKSLWTLLGEGIAKIITAILNLLKVLIFKGLDALGYLAGVMIDNIGDVFSGIGAYFDRYIGYIEENTFFAGIGDILPEELKTIMVLTFFSIAIAGIIKYAKKG